MTSGKSTPTTVISPDQIPENRSFGLTVGRQQRVEFVVRHLIAGYAPMQIHRLWNQAAERQGEPERKVSRKIIEEDREAALRDISRKYGEDLKHYRGILLERYEMVVNALHPKVKRGNLGAIDRYLKTLQQLGDVTGANAPVKLEVEHTTNLSEDERQQRILEIIQEARRRNETIEAEIVVDDDNDSLLLLDEREAADDDD